MRKLRIGVIDLICKSSNPGLYGRIMDANLVSIMPQVVSVWCEQEGHEVTHEIFTGSQNLAELIPEDLDLVFINSFTQASLRAYSLSNMFRSRGAVTALGGPHARSYPQDAQKYFDYVLGLTDKTIIHEVLSDCSQHRPLGLYLTAQKHPTELPGVKERWKFIEQTLKKAPLIKIVPMIFSLGCTYTCGFCVDSAVDHQQLDLESIKEDLRFLLTKFKKPRVGLHDPNFGMKFNTLMDAIEDAVPPGSIDFIAESSLSMLSEPHLKRLKHNGFKAMMPGIESWFDMGNKSKTGRKTGMEKVRQVADHVNLIMEYIPYVQTNFVIGLDTDEGKEPFECTKKFIDLAPGAFPAYSLLSAFGQSAPLNIEYQRADRMIPLPFHFLNNNQGMNLGVKNYSWLDFYDNYIDLVKHSFTWKAIYSRYKANKGAIPRWMNVLRAVSSEGFGRIKYHSNMYQMFENDCQFLAFFNQETTEVPEFYLNKIRGDLKDIWEWLPEGALYHDPKAFLKSEEKIKQEELAIEKAIID